MFGSGVDAHREGGLIGIRVAIHHQRQIEGVELLSLHGQTDQAPGVGGHEVDLIGGGVLSRADQIPFILATFVVHNDNAFAVADGGEGVGNRIEANVGGRVSGGRRAQGSSEANVLHSLSTSVRSAHS